MFFRPGRSYLLLSFLLVITCCFTLSTSADNPSAGKTKKAVEAADAATKAVEAANKAASEAARDAILTDYPDTDAGKAARAADEAADAAELTRRTMAALEPHIRAHPDQWFIFRRMWKDGA